MKTYQPHASTVATPLFSWNYVKTHEGVYFNRETLRYEYISIGSVDGLADNVVLLHDTINSNVAVTGRSHTCDRLEYVKLNKGLILDTFPL